jgi:hypothetical protein
MEGIDGVHSGQRPQAARGGESGQSSVSRCGGFGALIANTWAFNVGSA